MDQQNQQPEPKKKSRRNKIVGVVLIIVIIIIWAVASGGDNETNSNVSQQNTNVTTSVKNTNISVEVTDPLKSLAGFKFNLETTGIYTYNPIGENNISVTMGVNDKDLGFHDSFYDLDRKTSTIAGVDVESGYKDDDFLEDIQLSTAYESLAFDFQYDNQYFSGEISNVLGEPSKVELYEILEKLINSIVTT